MKNSDIHPFWKWAWRVMWFLILAPCVGIIVIPILFNIAVYFGGY